MYPNKKKTGLDVYQDFLKSLHAGEFSVYYVTGEEIFFHDLAIIEVSNIISSDLKDFNFNLIHGQDSSVEQVIGMCRSYPMMAEKRVVIVRDVQLLAKSGADGGNLNDLIPYLEKPNPTSLVVLMDEKAIAKTSKVGKLLANSPKVGYFEFSVTPDYLLADWVTAWANKTYQTTIEPHAAQLLVQFVGSDLLLLSNEIGKLATAKFQEKTINEKDVRSLVGVTKEFTIFELKDAITQRRTHDAITIADQILAQGDGAVGEILKCLGFFNSMFINIWQYLRLQSKGTAPDVISTTLGITGYRFTMMQKEARLYSISSMPLVFEILYDTDRAIKGFSSLDERSIFFFMLQRMCNL